MIETRCKYTHFANITRKKYAFCEKNYFEMDKSLILKELVEYYSDGKNADFAQKLGIKPQTISSWMARNTFDIELIYAKCEDLDANWLLTGKGSMFRSSGVMTEASPPDRDKYVQLLESKIEDQQKIIDLLEEKVEALMMGGNTGIETEAAAG